MGSLGWLCVGIYVFLSTYVNAGSFYLFFLLYQYQKINILSQKMCVQNCLIL